MSEYQKQEESLERELHHWDETISKIVVIPFSLDTYQRQKEIVDLSRTLLLRNLDALKQTESNTLAWNELLVKTKRSLSQYKRNVRILSK